MRPPNSPRSRPHRPSPLAQVQHVHGRVSVPDITALNEDPAFWKRFSTAVHMVDEEKVPASASSVGSSYRDDWLLQQHRDKRRYRCIGWIIALAVILLIAAASSVAYYFTKVRKP